MKYWLSGALSLLVASSAWAQDYRVVSSPSLKLDIWIDNIKNNSPASWCGPELPLRIVATGNKNPAVLKNFLPRVGSVLEKQCKTLNVIRWQMNDSSGNSLAQGSAGKAQAWAVKVEPVAAPVSQATQMPTGGATTGNGVGQPPAASASGVPTQAAPVVKPEDLSPPADTTPWTQFSLMDGCHFRTWWYNSDQTRALFVPAKGGVTCGSDGWLTGESQITRMGKDTSKNLSVVFMEGFPVSGLSSKATGAEVQITTVNNQRMVLADEKSPQSWMVVPYAPQLNGWQANGTVVVQISQQEASDESVLKARLDEVRKVWSPYLLDKDSLSIRLVEALHPQLKDPAAGSFRTLN
ncbi:hypothetical protein [Erwinia psidii]|uniref:Type VI secretion system-associated protein n=1 Tax=Erwinia psidii TaxID=69224 RepID=A0A3N6TNV9_9GAMM|nr:hypothetical protein [Erwinia psidii]MCX8959400.1 hypothetical protein [Erwinia psidii]MCX8962656.1 hypothetical protein [Erwinia psidii]MCX8964252.1 hypothetical protein [Erwinia psidii]RQM36912.1 hypothetical protein EB241_18315 [Erwinia psidii]